MKINQNKKIIFFTGYFLFIVISLIDAQGIGHWRNYLSYYNTTNVIETPNRVYVLASGALYSYSPEDGEVKTYSKIDGLNDLDISYLAYSEKEKVLLIVYKNANIDLLTSSGIYNLPYFKDDASYSDKTINNVEIYDKYAYLSTSFGILKIDLQKKEMPETYKLEKNTYSICIFGNYTYVSTSEGMYYALSTKDLSYKDSWANFNPGIDQLDVNNVNKMLVFQDALLFCQYNNGIFYKKNDETGLLLREYFRKVTIINDQLVGISFSSIHFWNDLTQYSVINGLDILDISGRKPGIFWIAQGEKSLSAIQKENASDTFSYYRSNIKIEGPKSNSTFFVTFQQGKLLVTGGDRWANRYNIPGTLMVLSNNQWYNFDEKEIAKDVIEKYPDIFQNGFSCLDFLYVAVDPLNPDHYFVTSYGEGLYEFKNNKFVALYNSRNAPFLPTLQTSPDRYIRLGGLAFDSKNNLYIASNIDYDSNILLTLLTNDGEWVKTDYIADEKTNPVGNMIVTSNNQKWISAPRQGHLFVIDDNGTTTNFSDDKFKIISNSIKDQKGETLTFTGCFSIAEDHKGTIWAGTDKGPILFYNPQNVFKDPDNFYCTRLILPYNNGTDDGYYLLETEQINAIAIDGANRKWLGTQNSGVYLMSETGMEILAQFTAENSPLISNTINAIAINPQTGEVFFATDKGLVSYMGTASEGKTTYSEVRAYPNPVRPEYDNVVTITNLIKDSNVKITDMHGNLIYQGVSRGGMFTWNCVNRNGERVKTGIYLVLAATPEGNEGVVTKIMIVK